MFEMLQQTEAMLVAAATSPWGLPVLFAGSLVDGFFPPVPSESLVIALAVLATAGDGPPLVLIMAVAAVGAFCGDLIAYAIGCRVPLEKIRILRTQRGRATLAWAQRQLEHRGGALILAAREIPVGRVAVNMSAGALRYPFRRFLLFAIIAAIIWAILTSAIGLGAGMLFAGDRLLGIVIGVTAGLTIGTVIEVISRRIRKRRVRLVAAHQPVCRQA